MSKNLKLSYVLVLSTIALSLAWNTLLNFFSGVGLSFVAYLALVAVLLIVVLVDQSTRKRIMDLFVVSVVFLALESIIYFALEFRSIDLSMLMLEVQMGETNILKGMIIYQNVLACFAFLFLGYTIFRLVCEIKGKKVAFVEAILGNQKSQKKERQPKELVNGSLDDKPKKNELENLDEDLEEQTIEIEEAAENVEEQKENAESAEDNEE